MREEDDFKYAVSAMYLDDTPILEGEETTLDVCEKYHRRLEELETALQEILEVDAYISGGHISAFIEMRMIAERVLRNR